jgi:hypothetical protein
MPGWSSPVGARALALLALGLAGPGCLAVYRPGQDLTAISAGMKARVLEVRAEPFLRTSLATEAPRGTRLRAVTVSREAGRCEGPPAVLQTVDGQEKALPASVAGPRRLEVYLPDPRLLAGSPAWLAIALEPAEPSAGNAAGGCLTVPLVAPSITWQRERAWGAGGFVRGQSAVRTAAGSGLLLSIGGWWRRGGEGPLGLSAELGFTVGWCGDFMICEEARIFGPTGAFGGQLRLWRSSRYLVEAELAAELTGAMTTGSDSPWLMATPRATVRAWRTGPRLLGFTPELRVGALGLELSYGYRFISANRRTGTTPVITLGLVVQPAL